MNFFHVSSFGYTLYPSLLFRTLVSAKNLSMKAQTQIQKILHRNFDLLKLKNPSYSIRSFARKLDTTPGTLSLVMLGKRAVSKKFAEKIADKLLLDPQERSEVLNKFLQKSATFAPSEDYVKLSSDQFNVVGEWQHFAILNLIKTETFKSDYAWIADRLGLSKKKVSDCIERMVRLELITQEADGTLKRCSSKYRTPDDVVSMAMRKSHHETLELAHQSLDQHSIEERDFTWVTFAFDPQKMKEAKALIRKFQDEFLAVVQDQSKMTEVYRMAIQVIPLTKLPRNNQ
jgi:uncharacterized protein (TIGR02147 family)